MITNLEKYKDDLQRLLRRGEDLLLSFQFSISPEEVRKQLIKIFKNDEEKVDKVIKRLPGFTTNYQQWYSESLVVLKQLLPDRVDDFISYYKTPKNRKNISFENYVIEDVLIGLIVREGFNIAVDTDAAFPKFSQQLSIIQSLERRFESSLFDIKQLVQADLFDSELAAARELNKNGFLRGAGAMAGVVLEKHLSQVCQNHKIQIRKKSPSISDFNDKMKEANVYDVPTWRKIQHLGDLRNLCDHDKQREPTARDVDDLIMGVEKTIKTIF